MNTDFGGLSEPQGASCTPDCKRLGCRLEREKAAWTGEHKALHSLPLQTETTEKMTKGLRAFGTVQQDEDNGSRARRQSLALLAAPGWTTMEREARRLASLMKREDCTAAAVRLRRGQTSVS